MGRGIGGAGEVGNGQGRGLDLGGTLVGEHASASVFVDSGQGDKVRGDRAGKQQAK